MFFNRSEHVRPLPRCWHHAVASEADGRTGLNVAANFWFVRGTAAHDAALAAAPAWPAALFCRAAAQRTLGDAAGACASYRAALELRPGMADARHNQGRKRVMFSHLSRGS